MTGKPPSPAARQVTRTCLPSVITSVTAGFCGVPPPITTGAVAALCREVPTAFTAWTRAVYDLPARSQVNVVLRLSGSPILIWWPSLRVIL